MVENQAIFDGWDADVILSKEKIAILWNGNWHFKKITKRHSVLQVKNRDSIKLRKITEAGYTSYVIEDRGRENKIFVQKQFDKFVNWLDETYRRQSD